MNVLCTFVDHSSSFNVQPQIIVVRPQINDPFDQRGIQMERLTSMDHSMNHPYKAIFSQ